jgi:diguanylate cyclase (GGDEF)-like protein/PAS domain S-box-containing protein
VVSVVFAVVVSVLLVALVGWQIARSHTQAEALVDANADNLTHAVSAQITNMLEITDFVLQEVAAEVRDHGLEEPHLAALRQRMTHIQDKAPGYLSLLLVDRDFHVLADTNGLFPALPPDRLLHHLAWVRDHPAAGLTLGRSIGFDIANTWAMPVSRPLTGPDGRFAGVVVGVWSMQQFGSFFASLFSGSAGVMNLLRDDGALLYHAPKITAEQLLAFHAPQEDLVRMLGAPAGQFEIISPLDNATRQATFVRLAKYRLIVMMAQTRRDALADWRRSSAWMLAVLALMLVIVAVLGGMQTRQFLRVVRARRETMRVSADLHASEARYRMLAENASDMIVELDLTGRRTYVSPASIRVLGYTPQQLTGISTFNFVHVEDVEMVRDRLASVVAAGGEVRGINRCYHMDGRIVWIETSLRLVHDTLTGKPAKIVSVVRDITARKLDEMRIHHMAVSDALTGLGNRHLFIEALDRALAGLSGPGGSSTGGACAVLFIDLDKFKPINDLHGHSEGDKMLVRVARRLREIAPSGAITARIGGDEFAVLLANPDQDGLADEVAARIIEGLAHPFTIGDTLAEIGASIGIACGPDDSASAEPLLRMADIAMYEAKRAGGGRFCRFLPQMEQQLLWESASKARMRQAITNGEFVPYYQKLIALDCMRLCGFEVLARWRRPDGDLVMPDRFIPIAEEMGLIGLLFESLLHQACRDAAAWPPDLRLAINVSPLQLQDFALADRIAAILAEHDFAPHRLEVEITENALVKDLPTAKHVVGALQRIGVQVALDDFGTGYSSVYHLKELHFDRIKIDKSFACNAASDQDGQRYLAIIVGLGKSLDLEVTAEGIEEAETLRHMVTLGCDYGQGYLFSRPQPASELQISQSQSAVQTADIAN